MSRLRGTYFDGRTARGVEVDVLRTAGEIRIEGVDLRRSVPLVSVAVSPRLGATRRRIVFADGALCELDDDPLLDDWFATAPNRRANLLAAVEKHRGLVVVAAVAVVVIIGGSLAWGLPWLARSVAERVPEEWVGRLGRDALVQLDELLGPGTQLSEERQAELRSAFARLAATSVPHARLEFRTWPRIGANAFALPDGTIVMTDGLVALAEENDELLAILCHELGHVHGRHSLQHILSSSGVAVVLYTLTGDLSGLAALGLAAPTLLLHMHYSRTFEEDADRFGIELMRRAGIDPAAFGRILLRLEPDEADAARPRWDWLSTHPPSAERARRASEQSF